MPIAQANQPANTNPVLSNTEPRTQVKQAIGTGLVLALVGLMGCRQVAPMSENYTVEAKHNQLVAGENQKIEITARYHRSEQRAAKLKYRAQFSASRDLTVTPASWDVEQNLTTNDAGANYTGLISIEVATDAAPGEREVTVTITPAQGATTTANLKFQVARKGG
jgi:hypothetical protein